MLMIALMTFSNLALAQKDDFRTQVLEIYEAQNSKKTLKISINALLGPIGEKLELNEEQREGLADVLISTMYDDLMEKAVESYKENFSLKEIKAINAFYKTPAGKKLGELTPDLSQGLINKLTGDEEFVNKVQTAVLLYVFAVKMQEAKDDDSDKVEVKDANVDDDDIIQVDIPDEWK